MALMPNNRSDPGVQPIVHEDNGYLIGWAALIMTANREDAIRVAEHAMKGMQLYYEPTPSERLH